MDIYVLNGVSGVQDIISTYQSCIWNIQYFGQNDFELVVNASTKNVDILKPGAYLVREEDITSDGFVNVMVIQNYKLDFDTEKGWLLTLTGKGLKNDLLKRRIVWSQTNLTGNAEAAIRQVITENVINPSNTSRTIDNFILGQLQGFTETIEMQLLGENLAEWLEQICTTYGYGWDVNIQNNKYVFTLYKGTDRTYDQSEVTPVVFSPEFDNLLSSSYTHNMSDYQNAALIGGEGDGINQRTATIGTATGLNRYEAYIDGGSVSSNGDIITVEQYTAMLEEYGQTQLDQTAYTESFNGDIDGDGLFKLNRDYFLGDIVQIENEKGIQAKPRIIEIIYAEDESGSSVVPTFSEWEVDN
jgi:hypothetical protein